MPIYRGPFVGATPTNAGGSGLVPAPSAGKNTRALSSNGTFMEMLPLPQYKNTTDLITSFVSGTGSGLLTNLTPTASVRLFNVIMLPSDGSIDELLFRTGASAPSPAFNVHVALWEIADDGTPSTYIIGGTASTGTTLATDVSISVTATSVKAGLYYISGTSDANGNGNSISAIQIPAQQMIRRAAGVANLSLSSGNNFSYACLTAYNQTTHETFTVSVSSNFNLGVRYA
jgi:hypothetical protein